LTDRFRTKGTLIFRSNEPIWHDEGSPTFISLIQKRRYYASGVRKYMGSESSTRRSMLGRMKQQRFRQSAVKSPVLFLGFIAAKSLEGASYFFGVLTSRSLRPGSSPYESTRR
jgi:hypothetical protein